VKNLAQETAEATARIGGVVAEVVDAQQTIAAAVEQQTAATTQARHAIERAAGEPTGWPPTCGR
jgi:hypothetical protein